MWKSWKTEAHGLEIKDIVWPGDSHVPPQGVPEKFHLTVGRSGLTTIIIFVEG